VMTSVRLSFLQLGQDMLAALAYALGAKQWHAGYLFRSHTTMSAGTHGKRTQLRPIPPRPNRRSCPGGDLSENPGCSTSIRNGVKGYVEHGAFADRRTGKAPKIDSGVGEGLSQCETQTRFVSGHDTDPVQ
jgi:hypothetical protein